MIIDLYKHLTTDAGFRQKVYKSFDKVKEAEKDVLKGKFRGEEKLDAAIDDLLQLCGWNLSILVPIFFPRMIEGKPLNPMRRPHTFLMTSLHTYGFTAIRGSRQIAKSTALICRQIIKAKIFSHHLSMYVVPHPEHKKTYGNRFREMERDCPYVDLSGNNGGLRNNLFFKEYKNQSQTNIVNCLTDTSQARSKTTDELVYDEYQLMDIDMEGDIEQCQSVSKMPMTLYAGTSTSVDSPLEFRYQQGSQAHWMVKSPNGKDWLDFGDPELMMKMIKPDGVTCPYTNQIVDVTNGFFEHQFADRAKANRVSCHVPQLIIPDKVSDPLEWGKIYKCFEEYPQKKFYEEILGIPTEEGAREITQKDLQNICVLPSQEEIFEKVKSGYYKILVSGCDWGGSDDIQDKTDRLSYTAHAILGIGPKDVIDILMIKQYQGMNFFETAHRILADHRKYGCSAMAADAGVGMAYNTLMDMGMGSGSFYAMSYSGNIHDLIKAPAAAANNRLTINRTDTLSQLYMSIKEGPEKIRCYKWEQAHDRLMNFLNQRRVLIDNPNGQSRFYYRRPPTKVDDELHAVNFGYVMMRLLTGQHVIDNLDLREKINAAVMQSYRDPYNPISGASSDIVSG